jgi:hypothetical protein
MTTRASGRTTEVNPTPLALLYALAANVKSDWGDSLDDTDVYLIDLHTGQPKWWESRRIPPMAK